MREADEVREHARRDAEREWHRAKDRTEDYARVNGAGAQHRAPPLLVSGAAFMGAITPPAYVIRPLAQRGHLVSFTGLTGHGKSTVSAMMIAGCLTGRAVGSLRFRKCRVLLLAGENPSNAALQLQGALRRYGVTDGELEQLSVKAGAGRLTEIGSQIFEEAAANGEHGLVVIDTSAAFFSYDDENDNMQQLQHAKDARRFTLLPGEPCVWMPCHPIKNATRDNLIPRGGGALHNEVDANLTVWNDDETVTLSKTKLRGPEFDPIVLRLSPVEIDVTDDEGVPVRPLVAMPLSESEEVAVDRSRVEDENKVLYAMLHFPSGSVGSWAEECGWQSKAGAPSKSKVHRILKRLYADKLARTYRGHWVLTEPGKKEAAK